MCRAQEALEYIWSATNGGEGIKLQLAQLQEYINEKEAQLTPQKQHQEYIKRNIMSRISYKYLNGEYEFPNSYEGDLIKLIHEYFTTNQPM